MIFCANDKNQTLKKSNLGTCKYTERTISNRRVFTFSVLVIRSQFFFTSIKKARAFTYHFSKVFSLVPKETSKLFLQE